MGGMSRNCTGTTWGNVATRAWASAEGPVSAGTGRIATQ